MAKYTDEQVKAALLCHADVSFDKCGICPMQSNTACRSEMCRNTLELINRQEAEIERLKKQLDDIECDRCIARIKSEAIKEFAKRLKAEYLKDLKGNDSLAYFLFGYIDNLVKEMVGEGE